MRGIAAIMMAAAVVLAVVGRRRALAAAVILPSGGGGGIDAFVGGIDSYRCAMYRATGDISYWGPECKQEPHLSALPPVDEI